MNRLVSLLAVAAFCITSTVLSAEPKNPLLEQRRELKAKIDRMTGSDEFYDPFEIVKVEPEKLRTVVELLRNSKNLYPKFDAKEYGEYVEWLFGMMMLLASKCEKPEADALLDESLTLVQTHPNKELRDFFIEQIRDRRKYGFINSEKIKTVDEAMKIEKIEWRDSILSGIAQEATKKFPPDFAEALRAAKAISDDDVSNRELCFGIIAVRQAKAKRFDDAEKTFRLIEENGYTKIGFSFALAVLDEEQGDSATARKKIDETFEIAGTQKERDIEFNPQFFRCCFGCMIRMKTPELRRFMLDKMIAQQKIHGREKPNDKAFEIENLLAIAEATAFVGDRDKAANLFRNAESLIIAGEREWNRFNVNEHRTLIASFYDAGFVNEGKKRLDEFVKRILSNDVAVRNGLENPSESLYYLVQTLCRFGFHAEAIFVADKIPDEKKRFAAYDWVEVSVRFHLDEESLDVKIHPSVKPFGSADEIRKIADLIAASPDGKSLENLCAKIRKHAERYAKTKF